MEINSKKTLLLIIFLLALVLLVGGIIYFYSIKSFPFGKQTEKQWGQLSHGHCLADDERVNYKIEEKEDGTALAIISISNKIKSSSFTIEISEPGHYHLIELHKCGVYVIKYFNYDPKKSKQEPGFRKEMWKYTYDGTYTKLFTLSEIGPHGDYNIPFYADDFRIDNNENFIVIEKIYFDQNQPNYALVIKKLENREDIFVLSLEKIVEKYPDLEKGSIGFNEWTKDGRYFWANIFYGANVLRFIRIDTSNWNYEVLPAPKDVLGGDDLNVEKGYITVHPGNVWFGIAELTEEEKAKRRAQGIGTELYIHNLFTNERHLVDKIDEPLWYFKPKWVSDIELEYELPTGEKKIYEIKE